MQNATRLLLGVHLSKDIGLRSLHGRFNVSEMVQPLLTMFIFHLKMRMYDAQLFFHPDVLEISYQTQNIFVQHNNVGTNLS